MEGLKRGAVCLLLALLVGRGVQVEWQLREMTARQAEAAALVERLELFAVHTENRCGEEHEQLRNENDRLFSLVRWYIIRRSGTAELTAYK